MKTGHLARHPTHSSGHTDWPRNGWWSVQSQPESLPLIFPRGIVGGRTRESRDNEVSFLALGRGCSEGMEPVCRGKHQRNREKFQMVIKWPTDT